VRVAVRKAVQSRRVEKVDDVVAASGCVFELWLEAVAEEQN
jgi:hypothetical protein